MSVPVLGTYESENGNFKIAITSANPANGQIEAIYEANYSPVGSVKVSGTIGQYAWVYSNKEKKDGVAPFSIRFNMVVRPDKRPYCLFDTWNGAYQVDGSLLMEGTRSYVNSDGVVQVTNLGTLRFSR